MLSVVRTSKYLQGAAGEAIVASIDWTTDDNRQMDLANDAAEKSHEGEDDGLTQDIKTNEEAPIVTLTPLGRLDVASDDGSAASDASLKPLTGWAASSDTTIPMLSTQSSVPRYSRRAPRDCQ